MRGAAAAVLEQGVSGGKPKDRDGDGSENISAAVKERDVRKRGPSENVTKAGEDKEDGDGIVYDDPLPTEESDAHSIQDEEEYIYEDDLFVNTNRIAKMTLDDSSSDEESD